MQLQTPNLTHPLPPRFAEAAPQGGAGRIANPALPEFRAGRRGETHETLTIIPIPTRKTTAGRLGSGGGFRLSERHVACPTRTSHSEANRCNFKA